MKTVQGMTKQAYIKEHMTELRLRWEDMDAQEKAELRRQHVIIARQLMRPPYPCKPEPTVGTFDKQSILDWMAERGSVCTSVELAEEFGLTPQSAGNRLRIMKKEGLLRIADKAGKKPIFEMV